MAYVPLTHRKRTPNGKIISSRIMMWLGIGLVIVYFLNSHFSYIQAVEHGYNENNTKKQIIAIGNGQSAKDVGQTLEKKEIISDSSNFTTYLSRQNLEDKILAGRFEIAPSMPIKEIASIVTDAAQAKNFITIPEGFTTKQIDDRLADQQLIERGAFVDAVKKFTNYNAYPFLPKTQMTGTAIPLEGFLFPDTYRINPDGFAADQLINLMLQNFQKKLPADITTTLTSRNISLYEAVTVASMLEREVRHSEDLEIVAGIMWKRVQKGWFLNIDATILYGSGKNSLTRDDLKLDSPYNTYTRKGLPLGPISNPGAKAILAAINPKKTSYWFYITNPKTGKAIFADTNEGQNRNRAIYLK